jgi:hypothetical protein
LRAGDVLLSTRAGVSFVPPYLVQAVPAASEAVRERHLFGKQRLAEGRCSVVADRARHFGRHLL